MSQDESLRLVAEVVDKFSTPMKNLRSQLQSLGKDGAAHTEGVVRGFQRVETAAKSMAQTAQNAVTPALSTVGVTTLSVTAALTGIGAAMRAFSGNTAVLAQASRDSGVAAEKLRDVQSAMSKIGIDADQSAGAIVGFAEKMRQARDSTGPIFEFLSRQGRTAEGRKYFQDLANDLKNTKDDGDALVKALKAMEQIEDPMSRRVYAQEMFGNADFARLAEKHRGTIEEQLRKANKALGPLDPKSLEAAESFERRMGSLRTTLQKLGTTVGTEVLPHAERLAAWLDEVVQGNRQDITKPLQEGLREIGKALREIDWEGAGQLAKTMLRGIGEGTKVVTKGMQSIVLMLQAVSDVNQGRYSDALKRFGQLEGLTDSGITGAPKNKAPTNKPTALDEQLDAQIRGATPKAAAEAQQAAERLRQQQARTAEIEAQIKATQGELSYQEKRFPLRDEATITKLNEEIKRLAAEMKRLREAMPDRKPGDQATAQPSSAEGDGPFMGAKVQTASFGGPVGRATRSVGEVLRQHREGIYAPEGGGLGGRSFGGGRLNGLGRGAVPPLVPDGPGEAVRRFQRGETEGPADSSPRLKGQGAVPKGMDERAQRVMARLIAHGWTPEAAASAVGQAIEESQVRSDGPLGDTKRFGFGDEAAHGMFQWRDGRFRALKRFAEARGKHWQDFDTQVDFFNEERKGRSRAEHNWHNETDIGRGNVIGKIFEGYKGGLQAQRERHARRQLEIYRRGGAPIPEREAPSTPGLKPEAGGDKDFFPNGAPRVLKPNSMHDAPGMTMKDADARREALRESLRRPEVDEEVRAVRAAGIGFGAIARRNRELAEQAERGKASAAKAGLIGGGKGDVNGQVNVIVNKAGPDAAVSTSASGNLFQDVKMLRGRTAVMPREAE